MHLLTVAVESSSSVIFLYDNKESPDHTRSGICLLLNPAIWPFNAAKAWKRGCPTPTVSGMCVLCVSLFRSDRVGQREKKWVWIGWLGFCWKRRPACQKVGETKESRTVAILEMHTKHKKEHEWKKKACSLKLCASQWIVKSRFSSNENTPPFWVASLFWELFWNAISISSRPNRLHAMK